MLKTARSMANATGPNSRWTRFAKTPNNNPRLKKSTCLLSFLGKETKTSLTAGALCIFGGDSSNFQRHSDSSMVQCKNELYYILYLRNGNWSAQTAPKNNKTQTKETTCRFVWQANAVTCQLLLTTSWFWWKLPGTRDRNSGTVKLDTGI